jgi:alpha-tubulin suppressor-like RCC1 family protein
MFGSDTHCCCGAGLESDQNRLKLALVVALEMTLYQQVKMGFDFTVALTRSGILYSWGWNGQGQLEHGHTHNESRPKEVIVQSDNGAPNPMVQVLTSGILSTSYFLSKGLA